MYDRILYPTDGSEGAQAALEHAIDHALQYDASLHVLYVVEETLPAMEAGAPDVLEALEGHGKEVIEEARERAVDAGVGSVQASVAAGSPYRRILKYVEESGIDLIVMGTHGRRGIDRYLLGSVAEKVVRTADCPVLTVRAENEKQE